MKKLIIGLLAFGTPTAFASDDMVCGKVKHLTASGDSLTMTIDGSQGYYIESTTAASLAAVAKANNLDVCIYSFYARGNGPKHYAGYLNLKD